VTLIPRHGLIVSCQARVDNPLHGPVFMAAMALAAQQGGAVALRANGPADIAAIRQASSLPIIGINKDFTQPEVKITPDIPSALAVVRVGAQIVALDCTDRHRPNGVGWRAILTAVHSTGALVMADIATFDEGLAAAQAGADYIATTLSGYTKNTQGMGSDPDLSLVAALARATKVPVIAEGRIATPAQAAQALDAGAHAVVVGTMITNPRAITERFVFDLATRQINK
jgi:putative N-acetylmannosamine-6-phosphate epimerase